jgi:hypothetical protein
MLVGRNDDAGRRQSQLEAGETTIQRAARTTKTPVVKRAANGNPYLGAIYPISP